MDGAKSLGTIDIRNAVYVKSEHKIYSVALLIYVLLRTFCPDFHHWYCFAIIFGQMFHIKRTFWKTNIMT